MLQRLGDRLVGDWAIHGTHVELPGVGLTGTASFEWMPGRLVLLHWTRCDDPRIPDGLAILGAGEHMHYVDERGVYRRFELTVTEAGWTAERPKGDEQFAQRMSYRFEGDVLEGRAERADDGVTWKPDLALTYRRP